MGLWVTLSKIKINYTHTPKGKSIEHSISFDFTLVRSFVRSFRSCASNTCYQLPINSLFFLSPFVCTLFVCNRYTCAWYSFFSAPPPSLHPLSLVLHLSDAHTHKHKAHFLSVCISFTLFDRKSHSIHQCVDTHTHTLAHTYVRKQNFYLIPLYSCIHWTCRLPSASHHPHFISFQINSILNAKWNSIKYEMKSIEYPFLWAHKMCACVWKWRLALKLWKYINQTTTNKRERKRKKFTRKSTQWLEFV